MSRTRRQKGEASGEEKNSSKGKELSGRRRTGFSFKDRKDPPLPSASRQSGTFLSEEDISISPLSPPSGLPGVGS